MNTDSMQNGTLQKPSLEKGGFFFVPTMPSRLHLENGDIFYGTSPQWQKGSFGGEVVFTTGMTGYDATLTDPSYAGQIVVFTYPLLGNYGIPPQQHWESEKIHAHGVVVCTHCTNCIPEKNWQSLLHWLEVQKVALIAGIDTRHLTKILRQRGTMPGAVSSEHAPPPAYPSPDHHAIVRMVSVSQKITYGEKGKKVILVDCGMKANILRSLQRYPLKIDRVPYDYDYSNDDYDGVFLSNGPGDPEMYGSTISILAKAMKASKPIFGICLGSQLLALAAGAKTYKLTFGHRSHNQPCIDLDTRRCYITSQNHGYAIREETLPTEWKISFRNLNDSTIEGIRHTSLPFSAVQFHPEAAPGPTDTQWLFEHFFASL